VKAVGSRKSDPTGALISDLIFQTSENAVNNRQSEREAKAVSGYFRKQPAYVRVGLWVLIGMIVVGLLGTTVVWYMDSGQEKEKPDSTSSSEQEKVSTERERQEALRKEYEGMLAEKPQDLAVLSGYARVEMNLGELYLQEEKESQGQEAFQRAVPLYQKALEQQDDPQLRLELAGAYQLLKEYGKAEGELQKILAQDPESIQALVQMGILLENKEDWDGAVNVWEKVASSPQADDMYKQYAESRIKEIKEK